MARPGAEPSDPPDLREHGAPRDGDPQTSTRSLYVQLHLFTDCANPHELIDPIRETGLSGALYLDLHDPRGIGVLLMHEDPDRLLDAFRTIAASEPFGLVSHRSDRTLFGRTYGTGRERNLEDWLIDKPRRTVCDPDTSWGVWYPLRRTGEFARLPRKEQGKILAEHGQIGRRYGESDLVRDVRLAAYGLDVSDNDFVIGLVASDLLPISKIVQEMRSTTQTSRYMESLGPFFVGKALWQSVV